MTQTKTSSSSSSSTPSSPLVYAPTQSPTHYLFIGELFRESRETLDKIFDRKTVNGLENSEVFPQGYAILKFESLEDTSVAKRYLMDEKPNWKIGFTEPRVRKEKGRGLGAVAKPKDAIRLKQSYGVRENHVQGSKDVIENRKIGKNHHVVSASTGTDSTTDTPAYSTDTPAYSTEDSPGTHQKENILPPGLEVELDFVTEKEEQELMQYVLDKSWQTKLKRRVQHYGAVFDYETLMPKWPSIKTPSRIEDESAVCDKTPVKCIECEPGIFSEIPDALLEKIGFSREKYNQLTVNEYTPGVGIAAHVETHSCFEEGFASVSLGSGIVMDLRRMVDVEDGEDGEKGGEKRQESQREDGGNADTSGGKRKMGESAVLKKEVKVSSEACGVSKKKTLKQKEEIISLYLPPRSRIAFYGRSRYEWKHGIASRTTDMVEGELVKRDYRISLTYRKLKQPAGCNCDFIEVCDWQNPDSLQLPNRIAMAPSKKEKKTKIVSEKRRNGDVYKDVSQDIYVGDGDISSKGGG